MSCYPKRHCFTTSTTFVPVGTVCDCGKETWETRESVLEKETTAEREKVKRLVEAAHNVLLRNYANPKCYEDSEDWFKELCALENVLNEFEGEYE